ncbi:MAG TPA: hypothetical protein VMT89_17300 [Candidatus Acidoferrales bacterium]|nr:hypothetical protein [Candidatus Acidoferrales bacterium]
MTAQVIAVAASAQYRETLSVLLEDECRLDFLAPADLTRESELRAADLVLLCEPITAAVLDSLLGLRCGNSIVAVGTPESPPRLEPRFDQVQSIALQPQDLRAVVHRCRRTEAGDLLCRAIHLVAEPVRKALTYPIDAWRSLPRHASEPTAAAILTSVLAEQALVIEAVQLQIERYAGRPATVANETGFSASLHDALSEAAITHERTLHWRSRTASHPVSGPTALVPLLSNLLSTYLRQHAGQPINWEISSDMFSLDYTVDAKAAAPTAELALRLATLALHACGWHLRRDSNQGIEHLRFEADSMHRRRRDR